MNIMIAADYAPPKSGNFIASVIALGRRLRDRGDKVVFAFPKEREWADWLRSEDFCVEFVNGTDERIGGGTDDAALQTVLELIRRYDIELIHAHFGMFHNALVFHRNELKDVKVIIHDHMDFGLKPSLAVQYTKTILRSILYRQRRINVVGVMEKKTAAYVFTKQKWFVPNGLSLERHITRSMTRGECREKLGLREMDKCVMLLGWDLKRKGLDIALKAVRKCRERDPDVCFGMIGAGTGPSDYAREFILRETGIDPAAPWIHFFDSYEDMFAVHRAVDVYLSASRKEAFSYGLLESISQDTPVVVSDIPGTRWADMYSSSFFYPTEDADACAGAIMAALAKGRGATNSAELVKKYGIDQWCDTMLRIFDAV